MVRPVARLLLAGIFIVGGWGAFIEPGGRPKKVAAAGIPQPELAVALNGAAMVIGGVWLGLGVIPKLAAALLVGCLIPTTMVGHAFWKDEPGPTRQNDVIQFLKNLGLIGGLLLVLADKGAHTGKPGVRPGEEA